MTDDNKAPSGKKPEYIAYNIVDNPKGNAFFNRIGAAWSHKDGQGFDVQLDSVPVSGRVSLREQRQEQLQQYSQQQQGNMPQQDRAQVTNRGRG